MTDYNPYILGFMELNGRSCDLWLPLQEALERFGDLPSRYGLLSELKIRKQRRTLNLALGTSINHVLRQVPDLKGHVFEFYEQWHRNWEEEFEVDMRPFFNRGCVDRLSDWLCTNRALLEAHESFEIRDELGVAGLIRRDVLNSIPDEQLLGKSLEILTRKRDQALRGGNTVGYDRFEAALTKLRLRGLLQQLGIRMGLRPSRINQRTALIYTDEISLAFSELCRITGGDCVGLEALSGRGIEFSYASRDAGMLRLGSEIGDCTAVPFRQVDTHTENIYWTVYPWMLDRNYLILKVHYSGHLVMKVHLLPLVTYESGQVKIFLAVDAIETALVMRRDIPGEHRLSEGVCQTILESVQGEILRIANEMGLRDIYFELFSNNPLVRTWLEGFEKIYLDVTALHKVDELEDVFCLAQDLATTYGEPAPDHVFMEIQFRNTQLMSHQTPKTNIKGFARLGIGKIAGYSMSEVIGV
ncbi:MAG: hypothetical protein GY703_18240 [Gammaproteobacteria bacterium]|nr:hypothetical protein [Gammaproteobacteria bacterium]